MASGDTLLIFTPLNNEPDDDNPATIDLRNRHPVLDFDGSSNEWAVFSAVMPRNYSGNGVTVYIHYAVDGTSGDIDWDAQFERIGDQQQDIDDNDFAAAKSVDNTTVPATSGLVDIVSIAFSDGAEMDNIAAGEGFRLRIGRDAANDTNNDDAQLLFAELKET